MNKCAFFLILTFLTSCHHPFKYRENQPHQLSTIIQAVVSDPSRPADAVLRDADRKPAAILEFSGIKPGDHVLEITPGEGYYTALLSRLVGESGVVYAVDPARVFTFLPRIREFYQRYQRTDPRTNVSYSIQHLDELSVATPLDQIWMVLYYHDTLWTGEDREQMNVRLYNSLKPGGCLLLIDHHAGADFTPSHTRTLHRIDARIVMQEMSAAGFVLAAETDILANPEDQKSRSVFDPQLRGKTDRFVWLFRKPHETDIAVGCQN